MEARSRNVALRLLPAVGFAEHLLFFDADADRKISPSETRRGLEQLGLGSLLNVSGAVFIHAGVAGLGLLRGRPLNPLALDVPVTGFVRHPDTELIDPDGRFNAAALDAVFAAYAQRHHGTALTLSELLRMAQRRVVERAARRRDGLLLLPAGMFASVVEWFFLWWLAGELCEGERVLHKEAVLDFYTDPSFFFRVAERVRIERASRSERLLGRVRNFVQSLWL